MQVTTDDFLKAIGSLYMELYVARAQFQILANEANKKEANDLGNGRSDNAVTAATSAFHSGAQGDA